LLPKEPDFPAVRSVALAARRVLLAFELSFFPLVLAGCAAAVSPAKPEAPAALREEAAPSRISRDWSDDVLHFVPIDRFADGDPSNNRNIDRAAKGRRERSWRWPV
jgi:alpha-amylase